MKGQCFAVDNKIENLKIFTGNSNLELAHKIINYIGVEIGNATIKHFSDGEISLIVDESVRGCDVYIVQSMCDSVNDNLMELLIMVDALRRASAQRITVIVPYYGYVHQDCNYCGREPITAMLVANLITCAGADAILTIDLHTTQIQGFFDIPVDNLSAIPVFSEYFRHKDVDNLVVASLDMGGAASARNYAIQHASTEYIVSLDADDLLEPTYIETTLAALYFNPNAGWAYTDSLGFQNQEYTWRVAFDLERLKVSNFLIEVGTMRKQAVMDAGLYDDRSRYSHEDWRLWLQILEKKYSPVHVGYYGAWYRRVEDGGYNVTL